MNKQLTCVEKLSLVAKATVPVLLRYIHIPIP